MPLGATVRKDDKTTQPEHSVPREPPPMRPPQPTTNVRGNGGNPAPTFALLRDKLTVEGKRHEDFLEKVKSLSFTPEGMLEIIGNPKVSLSWADHAWSQFCSLLEVPGDFIRRSPNGAGPASKKAIIDHWKDLVQGKTFLIRTRRLDHKDEKTGATGYVRAVLTDKYAKFDNMELLDVVEPIAKERGFVIESCQLTEKGIHLRLLDPTPHTIGMLPDGSPDVHKFGVIIVNSEVGAYPIRVDFLDYRQVCSNGATVLFGKKPLFSHKHVGVEVHEIRAGILGALDKMAEKTEITVAAIQRAQQVPVTDATRELHRVLTQAHATEAFVKAALDAYDIEPIPTRYGVVQAITRAAQGLDGDARREMEELGGRLLLATT